MSGAGLGAAALLEAVVALLAVAAAREDKILGHFPDDLAFLQAVVSRFTLAATDNSRLGTLRCEHVEPPICSFLDPCSSH